MGRATLKYLNGRTVAYIEIVVRKRAVKIKWPSSALTSSPSPTTVGSSVSSRGLA